MKHVSQGQVIDQNCLKNITSIKIQQKNRPKISNVQN